VPFQYDSKPETPSAPPEPSRLEYQPFDEPLSMAKWARNERLHETLLKMGLFVQPVFERLGRQRIDYFIVSCGMPSENHGPDQG
jgi:hypothetical protein